MGDEGHFAEAVKRLTQSLILEFAPNLEWHIFGDHDFDPDVDPGAKMDPGPHPLEGRPRRGERAQSILNDAVRFEILDELLFEIAPYATSQTRFTKYEFAGLLAVSLANLALEPMHLAFKSDETGIGVELGSETYGPTRELRRLLKKASRESPTLRTALSSNLMLQKLMDQSEDEKAWDDARRSPERLSDRWRMAAWIIANLFEEHDALPNRRRLRMRCRNPHNTAGQVEEALYWIAGERKAKEGEQIELFTERVVAKAYFAVGGTRNERAIKVDKKKWKNAATKVLKFDDIHRVLSYFTDTDLGRGSHEDEWRTLAAHFSPWNPPKR